MLNLRHLKQSTMLAAAAGFAVALVAIAPNEAFAKPKLHEASFYFHYENTPEVRVGAEDGRWVVMKSSGITYNFKYRVKSNRGLNYIWVRSATGAGGWSRSLCMIGACGLAQHTAWGEGSFFVHNTQLGEDRAAVLKACNDLISQGETTLERHETYATLFLAAEVGVWRSTDRKYKFTRLHGQTKVKVICEPEGTDIKAPPKPFSVEVFVQQGGNTCPKLTEVKARIKYQVPTTARFRFKLDGKPSKWINAKAQKVGAVYLVEHVKTYHLDPGQHHFRVEAEGGKQSAARTLKTECPPFQATSMWLTLDTENKSTCPKNVDASVRINGNGPGSVLTKIKNQAGVVMAIESIKVKREGDHYVGRLTQKFNMTAIDTMLIAEDANDSATNSGWQPLKIECLEVLSGKLTLQSLGTTSCKGEALVAIHTDGAGELPYELECGPGKSWQRKVTAMANKIGVDKVRFDVTNNEQVTCALRTRIGGVLKPLDGASMTFQCHKPIDTGADDLAPDTRPEDPPPVGDTLTGDFSFVDIGGTRCPRQGKALISFKSSKPDNVHYSLDCTNGSFSGVAQTAPSPKGGFIAPALVSFDIEKTTKANCALKSVAPGKAKVHKLKGHLFQCVNRTDVGGPEDLTPETPSDPQKPGTAVVDPVKPEKPDEPEGHTATVSDPKISCANGKVKGDACECEPHFKPVKAGKNAWRCVRSTVDPKPEKPIVSEPKISCARGKVVNAACKCDKTDKLVKTGKNAWACVRVVVDPSRTKDKTKLEVKTAPKKTAAPKLGKSDKAKGGKGKGKSAKKGNGSSALR